MRIFLYEFIAGGGLFDGSDEPLHRPLLTEALAMLTALSADLAAIDFIELTGLIDCRLASSTIFGCELTTVASRLEAEAAFREHAHRADHTIVIAPETGGCLERAAGTVEEVGGQLLSPSPACIALAADKHALAEHLAAHGVAVPRGVAIGPGDRWPEELGWPLVAKPCDGAGSQGIRFVATRGADIPVCHGERLRIERFYSGLPCSVAVLCGPKQQIALEPCRQHLDLEHGMHYHGGSLPLPETLAARARRLAARAVATLDGALGYIGVDLVLGDDSSGRDDVVIEINPRLTTSYVALRRACRSNLAAAMLDVATGREVTIAFDPQPIAFRVDGTVGVIETFAGGDSPGANAVSGSFAG
ncbi:MAG TPA: ATP-grasp domain-containing protein [Pirellulales bacterium]|nr:ATP-grasp domain-containing protein [Pirellulales bacterium]